jgi:hypothetical protein
MDWTPGPYEVRAGVFVVRLPDERPIAQCWIEGETIERREANARLFAAAPDMYAALKLYDSTYAATQTHPTHSQEAAVITAVRTALAKADSR